MMMENEHEETPMQRMQREALEEQAVADNTSDTTCAIADMQAEAVAEQAASDQALHHATKERLNRYMFDLNTHGGKIVNYTIFVIILLSVLFSMLQTIPDIDRDWGRYINIFQVSVMYIFVLEYALRLYAAKEKRTYMFGFYGVIDLLTIIPLLFGSYGSAIMRLARLVRILKLTQYFPVLSTLLRSVSGALNMIFAVFATIIVVSVFSGNLAYMLEPETFGNAFIGTWWSLVTMSTVGYGDLVPHSVAGMMLGAVLIMVGICVVAMMTAVIAVRVGRMVNMNKKCFDCEKSISSEYEFCPYCGQNQADEIDLFCDDE